jgi:hypothetical protein
MTHGRFRTFPRPAIVVGASPSLEPGGLRRIDNRHPATHAVEELPPDLSRERMTTRHGSLPASTDVALTA